MERASRYAGLWKLSPKEASEMLASQEVSIIGCGAIGRQIALMLATMGVTKFKLWDMDVVGEENLGTQGWRRNDVGLLKTVALRSTLNQTMQELQNSEVKCLGEFPNEEWHLGKMVFSVPDSMAVRKTVYNHWSTVADAEDGLLVDARMTLETCRVISLRTVEEWQRYEDYCLFSDAEAAEGSCTSRSTFYCASLAASLAVAEWVRHLQGAPRLGDIQVSLPHGLMHKVDVEKLYKGPKEVTLESGPSLP